LDHRDDLYVLCLDGNRAVCDREDGTLKGESNVRIYV
jgi:hypothetical protein